MPPRPHVTVSPDEVEMTAIRALGPGGQNVDKVSNAVHLRFESGSVEQLRAFGHQCAGQVGVVVGVESFHHLVRGV